MKVITSISKIRSIITNAKLQKRSIGFVPTMGALHEGHLSLFRRCREENDCVVVSIFVNPLQFAPMEDFASYPREQKRDIFLTKKENIDIVFHPSVKEIYPKSFLTNVRVEKITETLCGKFRPGHFQGVATVVAKLLNIVTPDILYLGQKDAQQCVVIQQMVHDLDFPVKVKVLPTIRERDGLAMSSRNKYLTERQRRQAPIIYKSLCLAEEKILAGERRPSYITAMMQKTIEDNSSAKIDYIDCVDAKTLEPLKTLKGKVLIALAAWFGGARLIDNIMLQVK